MIRADGFLSLHKCLRNSQVVGVEIVVWNSITPPIGEVSIAQTETKTDHNNANSGTNVESTREGVVVLSFIEKSVQSSLIILAVKHEGL